MPEDNTYEGPLFVTAKGVGYFRTGDIEEFEEDIEIQPENMNTALNGDTVRIGLIAKEYPDQQPQGEVLEVIERKSRRFVGCVRTTDGRFVLEPDDFRLYRDIDIVDDGGNELHDGLKVLVEMREWNDPKRQPEGDVKQVLGEEGEHDVEMNAIVLEHGFPVDFPPKVKKEAEKIQQGGKEEVQKEAEHRRDMRGTTTFTIDPWDAKDFDDGLSFEDAGDGKYNIGIHIADVSHYVRPNSELDKEARKRGFTVYLVDRVIPMLPEELSNDLCSLNPDEDKLAFSAIFTLDENGHVYDRWFGKTVIRSDKRFTYQEAQEVIDTGDGPHPTELRTLNAIAKKMSESRFAEGAIDFETDEIEIELDENNEPKKVYKKERLDTHKLIEEFMLLANREVAKHIADIQDKNNHGQFLYRIHDKPDQEKIQDLDTFTNALGYDLNADKEGNVTSAALNDLFQQLRGEPSEDMIKTAAVKAMSKATYSTKNIGHYGLAFEYYTHFTSPIRRYPDLEVHRILHKYVTGQKIPKEVFDQLTTIAKETNEKELEAMAAERESIKYKQVEYMAKHIGEEYEGVVGGISQNGMFVTENTTGAEGMIKLRNMGDDYYTIDQSQYAIVGEHTGQKFQLGDEVRFKVIDASIERKQLDYELIEKIEQSDHNTDNRSDES